MKLKILKDCAYAFNHIDATYFKEGQSIDNDSPKFISWLIDNGLGERVKTVEKPKPKENKALDNVPTENKATNPKRTRKRK